MAFRANPTTTRWGEGMQRPCRPPGEDPGGRAAEAAEQDAEEARDERRDRERPDARRVGELEEEADAGGQEQRAEDGDGAAREGPERCLDRQPPAVPPLLHREGGGHEDE